MNSSQRSKVQDILMLHHSHLDVGYTHSQPVLWELQHEYIDQAIDWLESTADLPVGIRPKWTCEATEPVRRWMTQASVADRDRFRALVRAGRIGLAALRWHTGAAIDRAGLERLVAGKREIEEFVGVPITVACQHDVNGLPWALADVLIDAGVDLFVMAVNTHLGRPLQPRPGMFMWEAPSGRAIRVFNGHHYTMFDQLLYSWHDSVDRMADGWTDLDAWLAGRGYDLDFVYLTSTAAPVMWDNAPPNPFMPDLLERWNEAGRGPTVSYATFDDLRARALTVPEASLPRWRGDWTDYWSFGYGSMPIETSLNQRTKPLLKAAEALSTTPHATLHQAMDKADLFDEHTFGYYVTLPDHPQAQTGELLKRAYAHEAHELASFAVMDGLDRLAGNPLSDKGVAGVLLCNPTAQAVTIRPSLPNAWMAATEPETERTARASRMFPHQRSWGTEFPGADAHHFGPVEIPANSWRTIAFADLPAPAPRAVTHTISETRLERRELNFAATNNNLRQIGTIESSFYKLTYDARNGRILSLFDRARETELLSSRAGMDFFSYVRERPDPLDEGSRYAYYESNLDDEKFDISCWRDWTPIRESAAGVIECGVTEHHDRIVFERTLQAPGVTHLVQRFAVVADDPVIHVDIEIELEANTSPQGIYFALPLALDGGWSAAFDTAGDLVRLDDEQLPGASRGWVTVESLAAMWDERIAVGLLVPDAPMVQFGDFHFGPPIDAVPRPGDPLLLAWPINNYWSTNFAQTQPGRLRLRYGFAAVAAADRDDLSRHAEAFRSPPLVWPVTSQQRVGESGRLPGSAVSTVKPSTSGPAES